MRKTRGKKLKAPVLSGLSKRAVEQMVTAVDAIDHALPQLRRLGIPAGLLGRIREAQEALYHAEQNIRHELLYAQLAGPVAPALPPQSIEARVAPEDMKKIRDFDQRMSVRLKEIERLSKSYDEERKKPVKRGG